MVAIKLSKKQDAFLDWIYWDSKFDTDRPEFEIINSICEEMCYTDEQRPMLMALRVEFGKRYATDYKRGLVKGK
jgi:hypothetical protein